MVEAGLFEVVAELAVVQVVVVEVGEDLLAGLGTLLLKKVLHLMDAMVSDVALDRKSVV